MCFFKIVIFPILKLILFKFDSQLQHVRFMNTFLIIIVLNIFAFGLMGYDKHLAKNNQRRISEKALLTSALLGGSIGSGLGMLYFRHKTAKTSYQIKFFGILIVQIIALFLGTDIADLIK